MEERPFDTVIVTQGAEQSRLSAEAFVRLPLSERIRLILGRQVEFLKRGQSVESGLALKSLMEAARFDR
jgi:hypothetical protein